jgi:hypothetical protein
MHKEKLTMKWLNNILYTKDLSQALFNLLLNPYRVIFWGVAIITQGCDTFSILPWAKLFITLQGYLIVNHNINEIFGFT